MSCTNSVCKGSYLDQWNVQDNPASMVVNLREEAEKFLRNFYLSHDRLVGKFPRYETCMMSPSMNVNFILKLGFIQTICILVLGAKSSIQDGSMCCMKSTRAEHMSWAMRSSSLAFRRHGEMPQDAQQGFSGRIWLVTFFQKPRWPKNVHNFWHDIMPLSLVRPLFCSKCLPQKPLLSGWWKFSSSHQKFLL